MKFILLINSLLLVYCAGTWIYVFYILMMGGSIYEPNRMIAFMEMILAGIITLVGLGGAVWLLWRLR